MSLSQDEISALLTDDQAEESELADIMSPEDIAAMLDESGDNGGFSGESESDIMSPEAIAAMLDESAAGGGSIEESEASDIMSPEAIAAMLDDSAPNGESMGAAGSSDTMTPEEIAAMLDAAAGGDNGNGGDDLDDLFNRLDDQAPAASEDAAGSGNKPLAGKEGLLTSEEVDILGEVGNISMGAVATTMYSLLDKRVSITTPRVTVFDANDVLSVYQIPFVVATIEYVEGITGNNLLVLKVTDAAMITDLLMGGDGNVEGPIELNEMHLSAMSEIMNQMMGASSTSLSKLLHKTINISPPRSSQVDVGFDVTDLLGDVDMVTKISFDMEIEGLLKSELIQLMPYELSREFAKKFVDVGILGMTSEPEAKPVAAAAPPPEPAPAPPPPVVPDPIPQVAAAPEPPPAPVPAPVPAPAPFAPPVQQDGQYPGMPPYQPQPDPYQQVPYQQSPYAQPPFPQSPYPAAPYPPPAAAAYPAPGRLVDVHPVQFQSFDAGSSVGEQKGIDLVYNIPLQVSVELGKTRKEISEILEFGAGTIVVLDKVAGDPVEIVVNGKLIARGEVVVIDENYGVRITDIINS